jgi:hypothetical protein
MVSISAKKVLKKCHACVPLNVAKFNFDYIHFFLKKSCRNLNLNWTVGLGSDPEYIIPDPQHIETI